MKVVFWGTPEVAVPFLDFLCCRVSVVTIVTQPDQASQRGQKIQKSPVKLFAEKKNISLLQPASLKDASFLSALSVLKPEAGVVVAYGKILPKEAIQLFPKGIFNLHFSLLPQLRGGAPIQRAILRGEKKTGVTSFRIAESLDTGNIIAQKEIGISEQDNAVTLEEKLIPLGILVLEETLNLIQNNAAVENPQTGEATFAPLIKKEEAKIDWNKPAELIARQVRALVRPGAFTCLPNGKILKILRAEVSQPAFSSQIVSRNEANDPPGTLSGIEKGRCFFVKCVLGTLAVIRVQLEGKKEIDAWSFLQGSRLKIGDRFGGGKDELL